MKKKERWKRFRKRKRTWRVLGESLHFRDFAAALLGPHIEAIGNGEDDVFYDGD